MKKSTYPVKRINLTTTPEEVPEVDEADSQEDGNWQLVCKFLQKTQLNTFLDM